MLADHDQGPNVEVIRPMEDNVGMDLEESEE
jgi:hypothetical protein